MLYRLLCQCSQFAFYGAQVVAYGAYTAIKHLYHRVPECFIVSELHHNPSHIEGIPVRTSDGVPADRLIIIAVTELLHQEIAAALAEKGYHHVFKLTAREEHCLMSEYYKSIGLFPLATQGAHLNKADFTLYETHHFLDKPLQNPPMSVPWITPIQAGAALTDTRICELLDNMGDNLSDKNPQISEGSVLYWIWKNAKSSWVGIAHYRRHLCVNPNMLEDSIDALLPLPYICYPNVQSQLERFVREEMINALVLALKSLYPAEYDHYIACLKGKYHYAYNLIIAKRSVFGAYCAWAFKVTESIEALGLQSVKEKRALGYVVEMLTSLYFMTNISALNIKHTEKAIYT